jgi:DNA excision repair protein ERCC-4
MACPALTNSFHLPALKHLGQLADTKPTILVDTREQEPLVFQHLESVRGTLITGDYSVVGMTELIAIERKTVQDLVGCCVGDNRDRFQRELHRLRGYRFKRLLIVGSRGEIEMQRYVSRISPKSVLGSLNAWEVRFDLPVVFCQTPEIASRQIETWAWYFAREAIENVNDIWRAAAGDNNASKLQQSA